MKFKKKLLVSFMKRLKKKKHLTRKKAFVYLAVGILAINLLALVVNALGKVFSRKTLIPALSMVAVVVAFSFVYNLNDDLANYNLMRTEKGAKRIAMGMTEKFFGEDAMERFEVKSPGEMTVSFAAAQDVENETPASNFIEGMKPYFIKVNRQMNCVTVYTYDENGLYTIPVKAMTCSVGIGGETPLGTFTTSDRHEWCYMVDGTWGMYAVRIDGPIMFHSVPFFTKNEDDLEWEQFNKLGEDASLGCVRLAVADVKWIFDNCPQGTGVEIYDDVNPGPLGKPDTIKITADCTWDPTDILNVDNPWNACAPSLSGVESRIVKVGEPVDILEGVKAYDSCGNEISSKIKVTTNLDLTTAGEYTVEYSVTDALGRTASQSATVLVLKPNDNNFFFSLNDKINHLN